MTEMTYEEIAANLEVAESDVEMAEIEVSGTKVTLDNLRSDPENNIWDVEDAEESYNDARIILEESEERHKELSKQWGEANSSRAKESIATVSNGEIAPSTPPGNAPHSVSMSAREGEVKRLKEKIRQDTTRVEELEDLIERDKRTGQAVNRYEAIAGLVGRWEVIINHKGNFELREPIIDPDNGNTHAHVITVVGARVDLVERFFTKGYGFKLEDAKELIQIALDIAQGEPEIEPVAEEEVVDESSNSGKGRSKPYRDQAKKRAKQLKAADLSNTEIAKILTEEGMEYKTSGVYHLLSEGE